ncbi:MAG: aldolase [Deltaproteobacteria bacterium]|nr:MAG: aldolase [Pseudomonadota bacterium]PIE66387.1 MAG: aldolase [Deltaproteobacteria bacterium]
MRVNETQLRGAMVGLSRRLWERGWVANHDGNISTRLQRDRVLCTPTGESKAVIKSEMLLIVDGSGEVVSGRLRPFSELALHRAWYRARADVMAVVHAHSPVATAFGVAGRELPHPFLPEAVVSLGPEIPTVPLTLPGPDAVSAIEPYLLDHDVLLLAGNGVLACGADLEQAYLRLELVEHLALIAREAEQLGGVQQLPPEHLGKLLDARKRAGLGPEARAERAAVDAVARRLAARRDAAEAKSKISATETPEELSELVRAEIQRVLGR